MKQDFIFSQLKKINGMTYVKVQLLSPKGGGTYYIRLKDIMFNYYNSRNQVIKIWRTPIGFRHPDEESFPKMPREKKDDKK